MSISFSKKIAAAAAAGLLSAACGGSEKPAQSPTEATESAAPATPAEGMPAAAHEGEKGSCKGQNDCKGQGGCKVEGKHECAGQNDCKGQGGCKGHSPQ